MREEDYGSEFRNEFQAAFALSKMEFDNGSGPIQKLVEAGKWCLVQAVECHCPFTDASLGNGYSLVAEFETFEALQSVFEKTEQAEWASFEMWGPPRITTGPIARCEVEPNDIPF